MDIKHTYRFKAVYEDGSVLEQNESDKSEIQEGKSRFFDVLEKEKQTKLLTFEIASDKNTVRVSLVDGHFELNGVKFLQHRPDLNPYTDFRLIYYRTVRRVVEMGGNHLDAQVLGYTIGWQVTEKDADGKEKNVQKTLTID